MPPDVIRMPRGDGREIVSNRLRPALAR